MNVLSVIASYAILALSFTLGKMLLAYVSPIFLIAIRMMFAGIIILIMHRFMKGSFAIKSKQDFGILILLSFIHIFIPYTAEFVALQHLAPSCCALFYNLTPFFSAFFSYIYLGETMTYKKFLGFIIGVGGIVWFLEPMSMQCLSRNLAWAYVLMIVSVVSCALAWIYIRKLVKYSGYDSLFINGFAMLFGGLYAAITSFIFEPDGFCVLHKNDLATFLWLLVAIIFVANIVFYNLYGYLLKKYTATFLAFMGFVTPVIVAVYDWMFLGTTVSLSFFIATGLVSLGIYIFYQEELKQGYVAEA